MNDQRPSPRRSRPGVKRLPPGQPPHRPPPILPQWLPRLISSGRPRTPFVVLVLVLLGIGITGGLVLNTMAAQQSFVAGTLQDRDNALTQRQQELQRTVQRLDAPGQLAAEAARLGMVPADGPAFLEVWPGGRNRVVGTPLPVIGPPPQALPTASARPTVSARPTASARPTVSARPTASARPSTSSRPTGPTRPTASAASPTASTTAARPSTRPTSSPAGGHQ